MSTGLLLLACAVPIDAAHGQALPAGPRDTTGHQAARRPRILGVYDARSGDAIDGAEVSDVTSGTTALTTRTGTVALTFVPDGGSLIRVRKFGYAPQTQFVPFTARDTAPLMIMLEPAAVELNKVVTRDTARRYISPGLQGFEERRREGFGHFIGEDELRKMDSDPLANVLVRLPGATVRGGALLSTRKGSEGTAFSGASKACYVSVYQDGALIYQQSGMSGVQPPNFERINTDQYAGVEFYAGAATLPPGVSHTGNDCGVLMLWTRER